MKSFYQVIRNEKDELDFVVYLTEDGGGVNYAGDKISSPYYTTKILYDYNEAYTYVIDGDMVSVKGNNFSNAVLNAQRRENIKLNLNKLTETINYKTKQKKIADLYVFTNIQDPHSRTFHSEIEKYNKSGIEVKYILASAFNLEGKKNQFICSVQKINK